MTACQLQGSAVPMIWERDCFYSHITAGPRKSQPSASRQKRIDFCKEIWYYETEGNSCFLYHL